MISSVTLGFLSNGASLIPNRRINLTSAHPGVADAAQQLGLSALLSLVTAAYQAYEGNWKIAGAALLPLLKQVYEGADEISEISSHENFPAGGSLVVNGRVRVIDELRVVFRAESEDELKKKSCLGKITFADDGVDPHETASEKLFKQGGTYVYVSRHSLPLNTMSPGDYLFTFGAQDDGWFNDVAVVSLLTLTILPTRFNRPVVTLDDGELKVGQRQ